MRPIRTDELLAHQRRQVCPDLSLLWTERLNGATMEHATFDCSPLQHRALGRLQLVEPRAEEGRDRPRNRHLPRRRVPEKRDHLLHEERVSLGGFPNPSPQVFAERLVFSEVADQLARLVCGQGFEHDGRRPAVRPDPARVLLLQIRSCDAAEKKHAHRGTEPPAAR